MHFTIKIKKQWYIFNVIFETTSYYELICKMIEVVQNIKDFRFSLINQEMRKKIYLIAKLMKEEDANNYIKKRF